MFYDWIKAYQEFDFDLPPAPGGVILVRYDAEQGDELVVRAWDVRWCR